jgi:two-component system, OmpR family, sensor histidine kinase QseC
MANMLPSIRTNLLINLLMTVTLMTAASIAGSLYIEHHSIQTQLDAQLIITTEQFQVLINSEGTSTNWKQLNNKMRLLDKKIKSNINSNIKVGGLNKFQVWSNSNKLLLRSNGAPLQPIADLTSTGLGKHTANKISWRSNVVYDKKHNYTIIVSQSVNERRMIENTITKESIYILLFSYPLLAGLVWYIIGRSLAPVRKIAYQVSHRKAAYLDPFDFDDVPTEIQPLVNELNSLFERLKDAFEREKRFAGDAAHELRTPLAVMSAQTQVALRTDDKTILKESLEKLLSGVQRSSHVVHQLLTMSRMVPQANIQEPAKMDLVQISGMTISDLIQPAIDKNIDLGMDAPEALIMYGNQTAISILMRNLVDNAIRYSREGGQVNVVLKEKIIDKKSYIIVNVIDSGPGIPKELRERVFERFFRIVGNKAQGSGLGLGIVRQIVKLHQGTIQLKDPKDHKGLEVEIKMPCEPFAEE